MKTDARELNLLAAGIVFSVFPAALILSMRFSRADMAESFLHGLMLAAIGLVMHNAYFYALRRFRKSQIRHAKPYQMFIFGFLLCPVLVFAASFTDEIYPAYTIFSLIGSGIFVEFTKGN